MALLLRGGSGLHKKRSRSVGFALPTILISSVVMLIVLLVAITSTTSVRTAVKDQYYQQLAQVAGEAGVAYAEACLAANDGVPLWSDAKPLTPDTDCAGNVLSTPTAEVLVVAGGGGGGSDMGGGGGGGGVLTNANYTLSTTTYSVTVGVGGAGANAGIGQARGSNGGNSIFGTMTAIGGGGGASNHNYSTNPAGSGGSGGGASGGARLPSGGENGTGGYGGGIRGSGAAGQGYDGGTGSYAWYPGGGGGAGGIGSTNPAHGGPGVMNDILGTPYYWGGGGGGSGYSGSGGNGGIGGGGGGAVNMTSGGAGLNPGSGGGGGVINAQTNFPGGNAGANTGGGGGGGSHYSANNYGGNGGSGIVVISYPTGTISATGGTVTYANGNTIHRFTNTGVTNFQVNSITGYTCPSDPRCAVTVNGNVRSSFSIGSSVLGTNGTAKILVVGGGGSGGGGWQGGGGGAGGYQYDAAKPLKPQSYAVTVGAGGPGGGTPSYSWGGFSSFGGIINAVGGGFGAGEPSGGSSSPRVGGSGGGGSHGTVPGPTFVGLGIPGQGNNGGQGISVACPCVGGGGGGAGGVGQNATTTKAGNGGVGISNSITGSAVFYAGGGGGSIRGNSGIGFRGEGGNGGGGAGGVPGVGSGINATPNTGGGGGAGENGGGAVGTSGAGGSGIVIVAYPTGSMTATGGTITTAGTDTIHSFTSSGTFEVTAIDNKAKTIPNTGYVEVLRESNGSVWRRYEQKATPPSAVPDQCSGQAKSVFGWNNAAVNSAAIFTPEPLAKYISTSASTINPGSIYLRKDFSVTKAGTYVLTSAADDMGGVWLDGTAVGTMSTGIQTNNVSLTVGCHTLYIKVINNGIAPSYGSAALSLKKSDASVPLVVTDSSWRVSAGSPVHYSSPSYYADPASWTVVRDIQAATTTSPEWPGVAGESSARWISTTHNLSGANYPSAQYAFFRDNRDIVITSQTQVRVTIGCDDGAIVYLDGAPILNSASNLGCPTLKSTTITLQPGTHKFGVLLYNGSGSSAFEFGVVRTSDGVALSVSDASWRAANFWSPTLQDYYSYDNSFSPSPTQIPTAPLAAILVVAGGGGGGSRHGGGGGAGGLIYTSNFSVATGTYPVVVGGGGGGTASGAGANQDTATSGGNSSIFGLVAIGGGAGRGASTGVAGGSGGGGGPGASGGSGIMGQGYAGGLGLYSTYYMGGGGGGAGGVGAAPSYPSIIEAPGGTGVSNSITGTSIVYAAGGKAGSYNVNTVGVAGAANTGNGGGGAGGETNGGAAGGSGVVIVSYPTGSMTATGGIITTSGGYTIHRFTSNGTFTITSVP